MSDKINGAELMFLLSFGLSCLNYKLPVISLTIEQNLIIDYHETIKGRRMITKEKEFTSGTLD